MNRSYKIIVLGIICAVLVIGTVNLTNNSNAEVTDIPSANIERSNNFSYTNEL